MLCYSGNSRFGAFFYNDLLRQWLAFYNDRVEPIGHDWSNALECCREARLQPLLLCYELLPMHHQSYIKYSSAPARGVHAKPAKLGYDAVSSSQDFPALPS